MANFVQLMFILSLAFPVLCEPACSKFDYEEKLLEKMVRMEFEVGQTLKEIKVISKKVTEDLAEIRQERRMQENRLTAETAKWNEISNEISENMSQTNNKQSAIFKTIITNTTELFNKTYMSVLEGRFIKPIVKVSALLSKGF